METQSKKKAPYDIMELDAMTEHEKKMNRVHIGLCLSLALVMCIIHYSVRPLSIRGLFENVRFVSFIPLIVSFIMISMSALIFRPKINKMIPGKLDTKQLKKMKGLNVAQWVTLSVAVVVAIVFHAAVRSSGSIVAMTGIATLLYLYAQKAEYDGIRNWWFV